MEEIVLRDDSFQSLLEVQNSYGGTVLFVRILSRVTILQAEYPGLERFSYGGRGSSYPFTVSSILSFLFHISALKYLLSDIWRSIYAVF